MLGEEHTNILRTVRSLAQTLNNSGNYKEAEQMSRQLLIKYEIVLGKEHPSTLTTVHILAKTLANQNKYEEAEPMLRQTLRIFGKGKSGRF